MTIGMLLVSVLIIVANSWHVISQWFQSVPGTLFTGIAHYWGDYFLYTNLIAQGTGNAWIFTDHLFTNELLAPTWIYWFYTLIGKFGAFGANPFLIYNSSIIMLCAVLVWLNWILAGKLFPDKPVLRMCAFLFVTTASNFPHLGNWSLPLVGDFWFSPTPALNRLGGVPHQIFQSILIVSIILLCSRAFTEKHHGFVFRISLILLAFLASTANPIQMLLVTLAIIATPFLISRKFSHVVIYEKIILIGPMVLAAFLGALFVNSEFSGQSVLTAAKVWEDNQQIKVNLVQFLQALGPIGVLLPFGLLRYFNNMSPLRIILGIYGVISLIIFLSPLPQLLGTTAVRWISPASYMLFPLIAVEGVVVISQLLYSASHGKVARTFWFATVLCVYVGFTIPALVAQVHARISPFAAEKTLNTLNHLPVAYMDGLAYIRNSPLDGVVMTDPSLPLDIVVPVFTSHPSLTGHPIHTLFPVAKEQVRRRFFAGTLSAGDARQLLTDHRIRFIIASPAQSDNIRRYPFATEIVTHEQLVIFTIP